MRNDTAAYHLQTGFVNEGRDKCRYVGSNSGYQAKNRTNGHPGKTVFFRDVVKNRDCPGNSGTDGHLTYHRPIAPVYSVALLVLT